VLITRRAAFIQKASLEKNDKGEHRARADALLQRFLGNNVVVLTGLEKERAATATAPRNSATFADKPRALCALNMPSPRDKNVKFPVVKERKRRRMCRSCRPDNRQNLQIYFFVHAIHAFPARTCRYRQNYYSVGIFTYI
jgi:hypothetical protein